MNGDEGRGSSHVSPPFYLPPVLTYVQGKRLRGTRIKSILQVERIDKVELIEIEFPFYQ